VADAWGIEPTYVDADGHPQRVADATIEQVRAAIGDPAPGLRPLVVRRGEAVAIGPGELVLETGPVVVVAGDLPPDVPFGYHEFHPAHGEPQRVIVTPDRCFLPSDWRAWGWAAQLYATRSSASWGIGELRRPGPAHALAAGLGAGFVLVNPVGAVAPVGPQEASPYFPASRRFRNPIYLRVEQVPGASAAPEAIARAVQAGTALNRNRVIDRDAVWSIKRAALEAIWSARPPGDDFERW